MGVRTDTAEDRATKVRPGTALLIGWQEWVALPDLGLSAIKSKIDTGAKTSALHASEIVFSGRGAATMVSFTVQPAPRRPGLVIACKARLSELRTVTSSNGTREERPVIRSVLHLGGRLVEIELTLTDRGGMTSRMLIGRQALAATGAIIDPAAMFALPRLSYKLYPGWNKSKSSKVG